MNQPLNGAIGDVRFAFRQWAMRPAFAISAVLMLAIGIGCSTAVFSVLYQVVLKPLPYPRGERLIFIHNQFPKSQVAFTGVSGFDYAEIKRRTEVFESAGVYFYNDLIMTGVGEARHLDVVNASASFFDVLNVRPRLGRVFNAAEDARGTPGRAVISERLWRNTFGSESNVIGRVIYLNGLPYTVIGIMPGSFQFPSRETQLWIPVGFAPHEFTMQGGRSEKWLHMLARLRPGVAFAKAETTLATIADEMAARYAAFYPKKDGWGFRLKPLADEQTESIRRWLYVAFGAVASVLLIACINVAGLLLIRETARTSEFAVRQVLGASKARLMQQMLTETGLLGAVGWLCGLLLAMWILHLIDVYGSLSQPIQFQMKALVFAIGMTLASVLVAGLLPAIAAANPALEATLKSGATRTTTRRGGLRSGIVVAQIAFAFGLIFLATQLNRSFLNLTRVPSGFDQQNVWSGAVTLSNNTYGAAQSWNTKFFEPLLKELSAIPGVESASGSNALPFNPSGLWTETFRLADRVPVKPPPEAQVNVAFPGYFETMRIPLLKGRTFRESDRSGAPLVAVIDDELARRYFGPEDAIGKRIATGGAKEPATIIGVVGAVHNSDLGGPLQPEVYYPEFQERVEATYLVLRMPGAADPTGSVRRIIAKLDPTAALYDVQTLAARISWSLRVRRFVGFLLNALAGVGLGLALMGLYGSLSHSVELRRREIGIRVVLGARRDQVVWMIMRHAGMVLFCGLTFGALAAALAGRLVQAQLFGVTLADPWTWAGVLGAISIMALLAALVPARQAAGVEPSVALRSE